MVVWHGGWEWSKSVKKKRTIVNTRIGHVQEDDADSLVQPGADGHLP
jgi:hypothetical protein